MKTIPLSNSELVAVVDDSDYDHLSQYSWRVHRTTHHNYAKTTVCADRCLVDLMMHRLVLPVADGEIIDHIDRDGLNNTRSNLRRSTYSENGANRKNTRSKQYKGTYFHKRDQKWHTSIRVNGRSLYLGLFSDPVEAAKAYDKKAEEVFGRFALTNKALGLL